MMTLERSADKRAEFRARRSPTWLRGWRHFYAILALGAGMASLSAWMLRDVQWWEWLVLPVGFLISNFVEWAVHKGPMHHPVKAIYVMYEKHTLEHHSFYTHESMDADSADDFDMVLFSLPSLAFFLLGLGVPIALLFRLLVSANAAWLFWALAVNYYVLYECFHLAYHWPAAARIPGMERLRRHHQLHHDPELMTRWNFNVTFPIFDRLFGTSAS